VVCRKGDLKPVRDSRQCDAVSTVQLPDEPLAASIAAFPRPAAMLERSTTIMIKRPPAASAFDV
jgi:hypothetical protein